MGLLRVPGNLWSGRDPSLWHGSADMKGLDCWRKKAGNRRDCGGEVGNVPAFPESLREGAPLHLLGRGEFRRECGDGVRWLDSASVSGPSDGLGEVLPLEIEGVQKQPAVEEILHAAVEFPETHRGFELLRDCAFAAVSLNEVVIGLEP